MLRTITVSAADISLFHVAAREMGDARHWWLLAELNDLDDPTLDGLRTIAVPERVPPHVDGLPRR